MDTDAPLDYAVIQIAPSENRYEALVCHDNKVNFLAAGSLDSLLPHLSKAKELHAKGCNADFRLQLPYTPESAAWFTKSTLSKFLQIVGSPDFMNITNTIKDEMAQLEEAKRFHLSLYDQVPARSEEIDGCNSHGVAFANKPEVELAPSDASKNELLRAMDLRLVALKRELATAFNKATGGTCSSKEITDLAKFSEHFGATNLKNCMCTLLELNQNCETADPLVDGKPVVVCAATNGNVNRREGSPNVFKKMHSATQVKYNVSPAKVARVERQSLSESDEESSDSCNEDNGTHVEERSSRTLIRSATSRRSSSPMRRIQIGRTGLRRTQPLTIKSLNNFQARERVLLSQGDGAAAIISSEDEASNEQPSGKKTDNNIVRMSVQDKINLFESKQRKDQAADIQKRLLAGNIPVINANKSVLRRWSAGMIRETGNQSQSEILCGDESVPTTIPSDLEDGQITKFEVKAGSDFISREGHNSVATAKDDVKELEKLETTASSPMDFHAEDYNNVKQEEVEGDSKLIVSESEWIRKQEAELLNKMSMMKIMENSKPAAALKKPGAIMRSQHLPSEQRGGFYDNYKAKREEKLRVENAKKRANKAAQFRAMQQILDERKAEMASAKVKNVIKNKPVINKPHISPKNRPPKPENPKKETSKPSPADRMKISSKTSTMPDTRKSWPSSSSSPRRTIGSSSPAKKPSGISSACVAPTCRKLPQSTPSPTQSTIVEKEEISQLRRRNVKETTRGSNDRILKRANEKKQQPTATNNGKTMTKTKAVVTHSGDISSMVPVKKSGFSNKKMTTRKSSVVPLESNPTVHKGSEVAVGVGSIVNKSEERSSNPEDLPQRSCRNLIEAQANELVINTSDMGSEHHEEGTCKFLDQNDAHVESETQGVSNQLCVKGEKLDEDAGSSDDVLQNAGANSALQIQVEEESLISSKSWLEIEEHQDMPRSGDDTCQPSFRAITTGPAPTLSDPPRVRHSLSQMLQEEESSEPDTNEWGNAENPPSMIYQKEGPKGLKRLLKFARKSKGDTIMTGWSSPSVVSEGEDDSDESKAFSKINADNLLRKATLHRKNYRNLRTSLDRNSDAHDLCSGTFDGQDFPQNFQESLNGAEAPTAKAARSFFSLSGFRGNKANSPKLR